MAIGNGWAVPRIDQRMVPRCTTYHWPRHEIMELSGIATAWPPTVKFIVELSTRQ